MLVICVSIDWAEAHRVVAVRAEAGAVLAQRRIGKGLKGVGQLHALQLADPAAEPNQVVVGIETDRGLLVGAWLAAGYQVHAINPLAASHYRERPVTSRAKSDPGDAKVLADLVRTDRHNHRPVAGDLLARRLAAGGGSGAPEPHLESAAAGQPAALGALASRLIGIRHGCLAHRQAFREEIAWPGLLRLPPDFSDRGTYRLVSFFLWHHRRFIQATLFPVHRYQLRPKACAYSTACVRLAAPSFVRMLLT
jgi:hypothetical protein